MKNILSQTRKFDKLRNEMLLTDHELKLSVILETLIDRFRFEADSGPRMSRTAFPDKSFDNCTAHRIFSTCFGLAPRVFTYPRRARLKVAEEEYCVTPMT